MSSSTAVNFAARQNKAIERALVFEGLGRMQSSGLLADPVYIGFGSVWFADFHIAHRALGVDSLVSMESDQIKFSRAKFNRPFNNIDVRHGFSRELLPELLADRRLTARPWIVWLDYDGCLGPDEISDLQVLAAEIPKRSVLLTTFNARKSNYNLDSNNKGTRLDYLRGLFGDDLSGRFSEDDVDRQPEFYRTISDLVLETLQSRAVGSGRESGFTPMFDIKYSDGVEMLTVGGYFPEPADADVAAQLIGDPGWTGLESEPISLPSLTMKEVVAIRSLLPSNGPLSSARVSSELGFELPEATVSGFARHYLRFPVFSDIAQAI